MTDDHTPESRDSTSIAKQLSEACSTGDLDGLFQVIYFNPDIAWELICRPRDDTVESESPKHFLHIAAGNGHQQIVRQLVEFGADVNEVSNDNLTPLSAACMNGHEEVAKLLVSKGAFVHSPKLGKASPILVACSSGKHGVVAFLLSEEPHVLQSLGKLLLYEACNLGHLSVVKILLKRGVDVNPAPFSTMEELSNGNIQGTPLYGACLGEQLAVVNYLMENGAKVTEEIIESFWEIIGEALMRYTKEGRNKRKTSLSYEVDPSVPMFSAAWDRKNLHGVHKAWLVNLSARLVCIDLSGNQIEELPDELLNTLPALEELDISNNQLEFLPEVASSFMRLQKLLASENDLRFIPASLFQVRTLKKVSLAHNKITSLCGDPVELENTDVEGETWSCTALKVLTLSHNALQYVPRGIQGASSLTKLYVDHNSLKDFPMPWKCPLEVLDASHNRLTHFSSNVEMVWASCLKRLNLSNNNLQAISWSICQLSGLQDLDLSYNVIKRLPRVEYWTCNTLHKFNLSYNKLSAKSIGDVNSGSSKRFTFFKSPSQEDTQEIKTDAELPVALFSHTLETLLLNDNCLQMVPLSVCGLTSLIELDLSNNPDLRNLPPELGNLRECWQLRLNKLNLMEIPKHVRPGENGVRPKDTLAYLRATLRKSVPYYRMKLMVVGLQGRGKTTLLAALKGQKLPPNLSTVGIVIDEWQIQISSSSRFTLQRLLQTQTDSPTITFSTWDLAGQSVYYAAHQMFLSPNTLYLAVWNVTHGEEGVQSLRKWLLNIQARAPFSDVVVVGTHLDLLPKKNRQARADALRHSIAKKYRDIQGFPKIVGNILVSALTGENMQDLKELIYSKALRAKDSGENIIGRWVPQSYIDLQQTIFREAERRRTTGEPPVLLEEEVLQLAKSSPQNDILGSEELTLATRFLHENGILLHYNDHLRGLNHLYFIDPTWVCDLIATIVTVRERNPFIVDGVMKKKDLELVLRDPKFPLVYIPQYLQLMERFEIALAFNEEHLLIPSMLPHEKPGIQLHRLRKLISRAKLSGEKVLITLEPFETPLLESTRLEESAIERSTSSYQSKHLRNCAPTPPVTQQVIIRKPPVEKKRERHTGTFTRENEERSFNTVRRNYEMAYIPSGFWSRLITRLIVSVQRWRTNEGILDDNYSLVYWRQGIGAVYEGGHFLVESYENLSPLIQGKAVIEDVNGIAIEVWSEQRDFAAVGFIVDQIDALISEWYPGLDETDMYGFPLVQRLIPCPHCCLVMSQRGKSMKRWVSMEIPTSGSASNLQSQRPLLHNFTLRTCAAMALNFSTMACPYHPDKFVSLQQLIPDLLLADVPRGLLVDGNQFKFEAKESQKIGGGGAGEVFLGTYRNESVAVKTFHSSKSTGHLRDSGLGETSSQAGSRTLGGSFYRRSRSEGSTTRRTAVVSSPYEEEDVEKELEKTKVVKAFWDLRQEVAVLCRLNHPCVVSLLGVSLRPLCFILELAPHGSLASVLDELLLSRETDTQPKGVTASREPILGRRLSYKICFQIASAIWYLHDCDIIYRDLKADNVLVWSLEETDLINVKVSDYGISCFATPQGVAGEEGTPGYQAPEIRTGVGYDEKVDIFSFAIFVFELLSGCRPFHDYRNQLDIKKAIRRGVRPSLEAHDIDTQLPRLELLMRLCWNQLPERRPSAGWILQQMQEPAFLCQCRLMPPLNEGLLEKITAIHSLSQAGPDGRLSGNTPSFALLWSRERESRSYSMINCETGLFYAHDEKCPGHRVLCMTQVDNRTWLGTEGCTIEVFGRRSWRLPTTLWYYATKAPVLALLTHTVPSVSSASAAAQQECGPSVKSVYASLANGTLIVLSQQTGKSEIRCHLDVTPVLEEQDELVKGEAAKWSAIESVNLGQGGMPAKSMILVLDNKELWVGCGNKIVVVDTSTLVILDDIAVYRTRRTHVRIMVTDGSRVWSADRRSAKILQWNVATRQLTHIFDCDVENPVGEVVSEKVKDVRRMRTVTGVADDYEPSYTESMFKEAMAAEKRRSWSGDSLPRDSDRKEEEEITSTDNESFSSTKRTLPVTTPGSAARSNDKGSIDKDVQSRCRSLSSETNDNGLEASVCSTVTDQSTATVEGATAYPEATTPMLNKDPRRLHASESGAVVLSEECASAIDKATFIVGCTSDDHVDGEMSPLAQEDFRTEAFEESTINRISSDDGVVNQVKAQDEPLVQERDGNTDVEINSRECEFVDREKTRQAFVEGRTKTARMGSAKCSELASMRSLQTSFKPTLRTPSLMSSKKRRSQRKQPSTDTHPSPKPWVGRPRLRVVTGSVNRVTALLMVEDTLWIGRGVGDVITVNVNTERKDVSLGHVFAKLESDNLLGYENGQVDEIVQTGSQKIVCLRRLELSRRSSSEEMKSAPKLGHTSSHSTEDRFTERHQLTVWEAWSSSEFTSFQNQLDEFDSLVD